MSLDVLLEGVVALELLWVSPAALPVAAPEGAAVCAALSFVEVELELGVIVELLLDELPVPVEEGELGLWLLLLEEAFGFWLEAPVAPFMSEVLLGVVLPVLPAA